MFCGWGGRGVHNSEQLLAYSKLLGALPLSGICLSPYISLDKLPLLSLPYST